MNTVIEASGLGKRYGRRWALADCTLAVPAGRVTGLVGPNGAGKTTLLQLAAGLLTPTSGTITVLGERPGGTPDGRPVSAEPATGTCELHAPSGGSCEAYIESLHLRQAVTYQPASRYWPLQWYETGIYLAVALALALAGFCLWWIRPDRSAEPDIHRPRASRPPLALERSP